jgi:hypothetical protein
MKSKIEKVEKLLSLAKSDNKHEAAAALTAVNNLIDKYQLNLNPPLPEPFSVKINEQTNSSVKGETKKYYVNGQLYREDGPDIYQANVDKKYQSKQDVIDHLNHIRKTCGDTVCYDLCKYIKPENFEDHRDYECHEDKYIYSNGSTYGRVTPNGQTIKY